MPNKAARKTVELIAAASLRVALFVWSHGMAGSDRFGYCRLCLPGRFAEMAFSVISPGCASAALSAARPRHERWRQHPD
jgi:hypothetical protein